MPWMQAAANLSAGADGYSLYKRHTEEHVLLLLNKQATEQNNNKAI